MAGNDNWAQFSITGAEAKEGEDDDWGDFGGFETAQPVTDPADSNTSGVISWATSFGTQPSPAEQESTQDSVSHDLSQEINQWAVFPPETSTAGDLTTGDLTTGASTAGDSTAGDSTAGNSTAGDLTAGDSTFEAKVEQVQKTPNLSSAPFTGNTWTLKSNSSLQADINITNDRNASTSDKQQAEGPFNVMSNGSSAQKHIEESQKTARLNDLEGKLSLAEQEKLKLKEELENLLRKQQELEDVSKTTQESLDGQKQTHAKLQEEHCHQLQDMRQAGHDALAIIVEEYKELSKQAVLEEREKNQAELHNFLEDERRKFQEILTQQQEHFERVLVEEREKNDERLKAVIEEEQQNQKLVIESVLNKERDEFKATMEMAIKETREQGEEAMKEAVTKEKEMHLALMGQMEKTMEEERDKFRISIKEALDNEQKQTKVAIQEALEEERTKFRETIKTSVQETKTSINEYIKEKEKIDSQAQQKQYLVMDLFLESARTQLKNLMEGNKKS